MPVITNSELDLNLIPSHNEHALVKWVCVCVCGKQLGRMKYPHVSLLFFFILHQLKLNRCLHLNQTNQQQQKNHHT